MYLNIFNFNLLKYKILLLSLLYWLNKPGYIYIFMYILVLCCIFLGVILQKFANCLTREHLNNFNIANDPINDDEDPVPNWTKMLGSKNSSIYYVEPAPLLIRQRKRKRENTATVGMKKRCL